MTTLFPFVDPYQRLENAVDNAIAMAHNAQWRRLPAAVELWWLIWKLHPECHATVFQSPQCPIPSTQGIYTDTSSPPLGGYCGVVARCRVRLLLDAIVKALNRNKRIAIHDLNVYVSAAVELVTKSYDVLCFFRLFSVDHALVRAKLLFGDYTSGAKLCDQLTRLHDHAIPLATGREFIPHTRFDANKLLELHVEELKKPLAAPTRRPKLKTVASVVRRVSTTIRRASNLLRPASSLKLHGTAGDHVPSTAILTATSTLTSIKKFKLKTLEEHRFATRFEKDKKVTPTTWKKALRDATRKIRNGDRIQQPEALYVLLEIAAQRPKGCDLAKVLLNTGSIYVVFHHLDEAIKAYQQCLHIDPHSWRARFNLGVALARQKDFVNAKTELDLARHCEECPPETLRQIQELLKAIETIQTRRNERAFRDTDKARAFTWRYLETLHLLSTRPTRSSSHHHDMARAIRSCPPTTPLLFDVAHGWNGPIANVLHEIHVYASLKGLVLSDELARLDGNSATSGSGFVSLSSFIALCERVRGAQLPVPVVTALEEIFPDDAVMYRLLVPNPETIRVIVEMQHNGPSGFFHAGLSWRLTKRRLSRSPASRSGGLWRWMELSMAEWVREITEKGGVTISAKAQTVLPRLLQRLGFVTPMDFVSHKQALTPDLMPTLVHADRGVIVFEVHDAIHRIRECASVVLQMFYRRLRLATKKEVLAVSHLRDKETRPLTCDRVPRPPPLCIAEQQRITRTVLETLDWLVEEVVVCVRQEQYAQITPHDVSETPVRTENRQRL